MRKLGMIATVAALFMSAPAYAQQVVWFDVREGVKGDVTGRWYLYGIPGRTISGRMDEPTCDFRTVQS
jgi:hypothetical protein